jgi:SWI/SNF-related matrix-associated actin-dependent regulator of chromatin subfamily A member 5
MQLRKCCNHPYLFDGAEPGPPYTNDEHIVFNAGKMVILDKLLKRMKSQGSRVLIFSQMSRVLDILEDYCLMREFQYCRIDGSTAHEDRISAIDEYNREGSEKFVFLLTTRAGGLGINLTSADIVVLYDSDWNPQADLQAMDRAHRIGQTKQVYVYRFVTESAIEEKVLERAAQKLRLDQLVIQQGRAQQMATKAASKDELLNMVQHGAEEIFEREGGTIGDNDIDDIVRAGEERTKKLQERYADLGIDDLQNFTSESAYNWMGEDFKQKKQIGIAWINPSKRERHQPNYSIDHYYKDALHTGGPTSTKPKAPRPPKQINVQDHQFYPPRLTELHEKETLFFRKEIGYKALLAEGDEFDLEEREQQQKEEQEAIDEATALTEEEVAEKEELSTQGFANWQRRDFHSFVRANEKYGRDKYNEIAEEIGTKTPKEVKEYAKVFWERYEEIDGNPPQH